MRLPRSSILINSAYYTPSEAKDEIGLLTGNVVIFDLGDRREGDLYDLAIGAFDLHAGSGECLGGFHTFNCSAHSPSVSCNNLDVVFTVKRLQRRECFGYLHRPRPPVGKYAS